ncbi:MAG: RNA polymerase sigma-70 factor [Tannerella sp.]|jgi:RNA polymerase sigma-70 factor (ECF subfamily)|nr:RNA polymerase sigma-70 factor [Tannerella sp.]
MNARHNTIKPADIRSESKFGSFYSAYYKRFMRYALYYVGNEQTAEDITHDAILYYWENRDALSPETDVVGYLVLTVKNKCLNYLKHLQVEADFNKSYAELQEWEVKSRIMTLEDDNYTEIFTRELMDLVTASLAKLPQQTRDIFVQHRLDSKPRKEIAAAMGVSLQKIDYHVNKANDHLHKDLKDYIPILLIFLQRIFE